MLELFLALAWFQMIGIVVFPILFLIFVFNDEISASIAFLALTLGLSQYLGFIDFRTFDYVVIAYITVIYLIAGCVWSLFKYKQKAEEIAMKCKNYTNYTKADMIIEIKNGIYNSQISYWILFFPISIIKFFLSDFVDYLISKMGRIYEYIARTVVDSVYKETK